MKVIVAGFPKTGTKTMCAAFKILGYNVYDFMENTTYLGEKWIEIINDGWTTEDFKEMYEDIDVVTDIPCCYFWEEIHKAFPDAKIILMTRDEESWYKSVECHLIALKESLALRILSTLSPTARMAFGNLFNRCLGPVVFGMSKGMLWNPLDSKTWNKDLLKMKFRAHNAYVLQNAPQDKLLVLNISEGWKPLCNFLQLPIPNQPFPHKNKRAAVLNEVLEKDPIALKMHKELMSTLGVIVTLTVVGGCFFIIKGPRNIWNSAVDFCEGLFPKYNS